MNNNSTCPCYLQESTTVNVTMDTDSSEKMGAAVGVIVFTISCVLVVLAFISNLFIQTLLVTRGALRKQTYTVLVLSLGFGDTMISVAGVLWLVLQKVNLSIRGPLCGIMLSLFIIGTFLSLYITFLICLNRFLVTTNVPWNKTLFSGQRKLWLMVVPSLIDSCLIMTLSPLWERDITQCNVKNIIGRENITFSVVLMVTNIPLLVTTIVLYVVLVRRLMKQFVNVAVHTNGTNTAEGSLTQEKKQQRLSAVKTLGIIITVLLFCTSPFIFSMVGILFGVQLQQSHRIVLTWAQMVNSFANPIIYTWRVRAIRNEVRKMVSCCCEGSH